MAEPTISVYLADDHELVREGLRAVLEAAGYAVAGEAGTVEQAIDGIANRRPAVAVIDVHLAGGSGIDVCRRSTVLSPGTACLMLASYTDDESLFAAIEAGAAGYLSTKIRTPELVEAISRVAAGERMLDTEAAARVFDRLRYGRTSNDPRLDALNLSERLVLSLLTEGLSNKEIGERMCLAEKTVKNYVSRVLRALDLRSRTQAALYASNSPGLKQLVYS
jgi:DNA-binding NarL/FixJ family response regulator